jgi:hypothetical protein
MPSYGGSLSGGSVGVDEAGGALALGLGLVAPEQAAKTIAVAARNAVNGNHFDLWDMLPNSSSTAPAPDARTGLPVRAQSAASAVRHESAVIGGCAEA